MIYKTKGLSPEEVDVLYQKVDFTSQSDRFVPTLKFRDMIEMGAG